MISFDESSHKLTFSASDEGLSLAGKPYYIKITLKNTDGLTSEYTQGIFIASPPPLSAIILDDLVAEDEGENLEYETAANEEQQIVEEETEEHRTAEAEKELEDLEETTI